MDWPNSKIVKLGKAMIKSHQNLRDVFVTIELFLGFLVISAKPVARFNDMYLVGTCMNEELNWNRRKLPLDT